MAEATKVVGQTTVKNPDIGLYVRALIALAGEVADKAPAPKVRVGRRTVRRG